jgi:hypothetical protein
VLRFLFGFVLCALLFVGGAYVYLGKGAVGDACLGRCATGTHCDDKRCVPLISSATAPLEPKSRRRRRTLLSNNGIGSAEPEKKLQPGDERSVTTGDALGRPEHIDLSQGGDEKELPQGEIDRVWSGVEPELSRCISDAVGDWPLESGKIEVGYRIEKDGSVHKIRLTAPQLLMRNGLYACMRGKVSALKFPRSGGASVVTFPFQLQ